MHFGNTVVGTSYERQIALSTTRQITISSIAATGDFSYAGGTCIGVLPARTQCLIAVRFTPTAAGFRTGRLSVFRLEDDDDDPEMDRVARVNLDGSGVPVKLTSITVTPPSPAIPLGRTQQFTAMGSYNNGTFQNLTASAAWTSSNPSVAAVNAGGLATSASQGTVTITAAVGSIAGSTPMTVGPPVLVSLSLQPSSLALRVGESRLLTATGNYSDATTQNLTASAAWSTNEPRVATVSAGLVTAFQAGATIVQAVVGGFSAPATVSVTESPVTSMNITPPYYFMGVSASRQLSVTATRADGTVSNVTQLAAWTSFNPSIASVGATGLATCQAVGVTTINAGYGGFNTTMRLDCPVRDAGNLMQAQRLGHSATALSDGRVLVAGGQTNFGGPPLGSADLFSPFARTFSAGGAMNVPRVRHTATLLPNGKVLIAGGSGQASAELYDPATSIFSMTGSMSAAREGHTATLLPNGKVLVAGGFTSAAELYDPATGTFQPVSPMSILRTFHTATLLADGRVFVAGGNSTSGATASTELFDPVTASFIPGPVMTALRTQHAAVALPNGRIFVTGGRDNASSLSSTEIYDPTTGTVAAAQLMPIARDLHTATLLRNGKVLLAGGETIGSPSIANADLFDPSTGAYASGVVLSGQFTGSRSAHTATEMSTGEVLLAGGFSQSIATAVCQTFASLF
ncbi:MAG: Ig-like domain-containing protein [Acidobacteria bacterium]|nr:Ig-like domain-containing protein [Acidobacteriota bacterium]